MSSSNKLTLVFFAQKWGQTHLHGGLSGEVPDPLGGLDGNIRFRATAPTLKLYSALCCPVSLPPWNLLH